MSGQSSEEPTSYDDLRRVENGKIAERRDVMETIAEEAARQNQDGRL